MYEKFFELAIIMANPLSVLIVIMVTIKHFKILRTLVYIERFNSPNFIQVRRDIERWLSICKDDKERIEKSYETELFCKICTFINLFQEMGLAYKYRLVNRDILFEHFDFIVISYYERLKFYIEYRRKQNSNSVYLFRKFENLYSEFLNLRNKSNKRFQKIR